MPRNPDTTFVDPSYPLKPGEVWLPGHEGRYSVEREGHVNSFFTGTRKRLKARLNRGGYERVAIYKNGKRRNARVHQLVLEAFVGPCPPGMECDHIDGTKTNNHIDNLEWVTKPESIRRAHALGLMRQDGAYNNGAKLDAKDVRMLRYLVSQGVAQSTVEKIFGLKPKGAWPIANGKTWKKVTEAATIEEQKEARTLLALVTAGSGKQETAMAVPGDLHEQAVRMLCEKYGGDRVGFGPMLRRQLSSFEPEMYDELIKKFPRLPRPDMWRSVPFHDKAYLFPADGEEFVVQLEVWEVIDAHGRAQAVLKWVELWWFLDSTEEFHLDIRVWDTLSQQEIEFSTFDLAYRAGTIEDIKPSSTLSRLFHKLRVGEPAQEPPNV